MREIGSGNAGIEVDGHRVDVYLNRPDKRNALNRQTIADVTEAMRAAQDVEDVRAITILGKGPVLCAGMDLEMMYEADRETHEEIGAEFRELREVVHDCDVPTVGGIKRAAVAGAFELVLPADFRVIGENAQYGLLEVNLGVFPSGGSTQLLPRMVGLSKAKEIVMSGELIDPQEAADIGLVHEIVPEDEDVDEATKAYADDLTEKAPLGMRRAKVALNDAFDVSLDAGLDMEASLSHDLYTTHDRKEGFKARLEGREPEFEGE